MATFATGRGATCSGFSACGSGARFGSPTTLSRATVPATTTATDFLLSMISVCAEPGQKGEQNSSTGGMQGEQSAIDTAHCHIARGELMPMNADRIASAQSQRHE